MSPRLRNFAVGITVLAALVCLGWLIFTFGAEPAKFLRPPQLSVTFVAARGDGLGAGSNIDYKGVTVGRVIEVKRRAETDDVLISAIVDKNPPLPGNLVADIIFTSPLGGVSALELKVASGKAEGALAEGAQLEARYLGSTFLPPEFAELARSAQRTVDELNRADLVGSIKKAVETTQARIDQTGTVIEGISTLVNDPKLRTDLQASLASIRATSDNAREISDRLKGLTDKFTSITDNTDKAVIKANDTLATTQKRIDELGSALATQLVTVGRLLNDVNSITTKIDKGQGTAGLLVNDPKLYEALVDSMKKVDVTMATVQRLTEQWEQEGLTFKLGK